MARSNLAPVTRGAGRAPGSRNRKLVTAREAIALAAERLGGVERLVAWAQEAEANERVFWTTIYPKLLPLQLNGAGEEGEHLQSLTVKFVRPGR